MNERNLAKKELCNWKIRKREKSSFTKFHRTIWLHGFLFFCLIRWVLFFSLVYSLEVCDLIHLWIAFLCYDVLFISTGDEYILKILFSRYYTLKPFTAFPFKFILDFSLSLIHIILFCWFWIKFITLQIMSPYRHPLKLIIQNISFFSSIFLPVV